MWSIFFNLGINLQNVLNLEEDIQKIHYLEKGMEGQPIGIWKRKL